MPISKNIILTKDRIDDVDLTSLTQYISWNPTFLQYFVQAPGQEPYKLLGYMSMHVQGTITDIGTQFGSSALALSLHNQVNVETYDTFKHIPDPNPQIQTIANKSNIKYRILSGQAVISKVAESTIVYLDINTTTGTEELKIINQLKELGFKGILVIDDIHLNSVMKDVWNNVPQDLKKIDATSLGHWSGTGIVVYEPTYIDVNMSNTD
jgi:uncharacterized lipoprotein YehR (DUF1307 family)